MQETPGDAFLGSVSDEQIASLAELYDRFAHALDPFSAEANEAEKVFLQNVADWYDSITLPKPSLHEFRKAVIVRCKRYLAKN